MSGLPAERSLSVLLRGLAEVPVDVERPIRALAMDSRRVEEGGLFLACAGTARHGMSHLEDAIHRGAAAVALEPIAGMGAGHVDFIRLRGKEVPVIPVRRLGELAGEIASRFYGRPSERLIVVGVTGTNGKTSVAQYVAQALHRDGPVGVIGTLGAGLLRHQCSTGHTTPDAVTVQGLLADFVAAGARTAVMEVSSHGLHQGRVNGVGFDIAVFTNLTHEHLDYHAGFEDYAEAKWRLFDMPGLKTAVINSDDEVGRRWLSELAPGLKAMSYGLSERPQRPELWARSVRIGATGLALDIVAGSEEVQLTSTLLGRFNASNLLAALGALLGAGLNLQEAAARLGQVSAVPGRMEQFGGTEGRCLVVVDYAHTPDALEQALGALREHAEGKLLCVFGCGGDRDRSKRPAMGKVARQLADIVVLTDDNPRSEDPDQIIREIQRGMDNLETVFVERDRRRAIRYAIEKAGPRDIVLVAGKGHETEQHIGDRRLPFSDRAVVSELLGEGADG